MPPATIHRILSPATVANVLMHVVLLSTFVAVLFFTYGSKIERSVVQKQTTFIVDSLTRDVKAVMTPSQLESLKPYLNRYLKVPDMSTEDQLASQKNQALVEQSIRWVGGIVLVGMVGIGLLWIMGQTLWQGQYSWSLPHLIKENLITLLFVAITEIFFLTFIAQNFKSADPNSVKLDVIQSLQNFAQS